MLCFLFYPEDGGSVLLRNGGNSLPDYPDTSHVWPLEPIVRFYRSLFWYLPRIPTSMYGSLYCYSHLQLFQNSFSFIGKCVNLNPEFELPPHRVSCCATYIAIVTRKTAMSSRRTGASSYLIFLAFPLPWAWARCFVTAELVSFTALYDLFTAWKTHAKQFDGWNGMKRLFLSFCNTCSSYFFMYTSILYFTDF